MNINVTTVDNENKQLIFEDLNKVVANPAKNKIYSTPSSPKYMNSVQIKEANVEKYLNLALETSADFYNYVTNYRFPIKRKELFVELENYWNNIKSFNKK